MWLLIYVYLSNQLILLCFLSFPLLCLRLTFGRTLRAAEFQSKSTGASGAKDWEAIRMVGPWMSDTPEAG